MNETLTIFLSRFSSADHEHLAALTSRMALLLMAISILYLFSRRLLVPLLEKLAARSSFQWDDHFIASSFFLRLVPLPALLLLAVGADTLLHAFPSASLLVKKTALILLTICGIRLFNATLTALHTIYDSTKLAGEWPVQGYLAGLKIITAILGALGIISIITGKSPWGIVSLLGGLTALILLLFKDTILGFVANLQLTANDMIRVGDWIEMPKRGADGDVIDISLHTVKVQNWDKTITTIPTYLLVTEDFKNWRGMTLSGGRRIKRSLTIDISSIHFCSAEMLEHFKKYTLLEEYLRQKEEEIAAYNRSHQPDQEKFGGRRQTNIGIFRAYIIAYLRNNPLINQELTFLVRHLQPTAQGLPIELYVFSADQKWANYEAIQADIFDHLLAIAPEFGLRIFQYPSGFDLQRIVQTAYSENAL